MLLFQLVLALSLLGYLAFVFFAETLNPFSRHPFVEVQKRIRMARLIGFLIALSPIAVLGLEAESFFVKFAYCLLFVTPFVLLVLTYHFVHSEVSESHSIHGETQWSSI